MADNVIRTISFRGTSEGLDELLTKVKALAAEEKNLALVSDDVSKRSLSLEASWKRRLLSLDENARALDNYTKAMKQNDAALKQAAISPEQHAHMVQLLTNRYGEMGKGAATAVTHVNNLTASSAALTKQSSRNAAEMLNLSRQVADVGVSLQAGQSLFTVAIQQGAQIVDVFASSNRSIGEVFSSAVGWVGRFVTSTAGVVTGLAAIAAGALYMGQSFVQAQKDIDKALSATGGASGISRSGINQIANQTAGGGMSTAQARETATAFAATGRIYQDTALQATAVTRDFARSMGVEIPDATKLMTAALLDPSKGALDLEKQLNFLDMKTLNYIRTLQAAGDLQGAQKAMLDALNVSVQKQMGFVGSATDAWNVFKATISDVMDAVGKVGAGLFEMGTGIEAGGLTNEQRLGRSKMKQQSLRGVDTTGMDPGTVQAYQEAVAAANAEVAKFQARLDEFAASTATAKFNQMALDADAYARALLPAIEQTEQLRQKVAQLEQLKMEAQMRGGDLSPAAQAELDIETKMLALKEQEVAVEQRKAQVFNETASRYPQVSAAVAQILDVQKAELDVASATGEIAKANAQHELDILTAKQAGLSVSEATLVADGKRAQVLAAMPQKVDYNISAYEKSQGVISTYKESVDDAADSTEGLNKQTSALTATVGEGRPVVIAFGRAWGNYMDYAGEYQRRLAQQEQGVRNLEAATKDAAIAADNLLRSMLSFAPTIAVALGSVDALFKTKSGGYSQFNPAGYTSSYDPGGLMASNVARAEQTYGKGGFDVEYIGSFPSFVPNESGLAYVEQQKNKAFESTVGLATTGGNFSGINDLIARGGIFTGGESDPTRLAAMTRAIDLLSPQDQTAPLQGIRGQLQSLPQTIQTAELIKQLNDKLEQLAKATDANTSATQSMTDVLSPFYSQDPRSTHLGFRAFAGGGIMTQHGMLPLRQYQSGGMATSPQVAVFGEGSTPEAYVPVPSGRIPVEIKQAANSNRRPINVTINVHGNADSGTVAALKSTAFQQAQAMRRVMG